MPPARDRHHRGTRSPHKGGRVSEGSAFHACWFNRPQATEATRRKAHRIRNAADRTRRAARSRSAELREGVAADWWRPPRPTPGVRTATAPARAPRDHSHRDTESGGDARATARTGREATLARSTRAREPPKSKRWCQRRRDQALSGPGIWTAPRDALLHKRGPRLRVHGTHRVPGAPTRRPRGDKGLERFDRLTREAAP